MKQFILCFMPMTEALKIKHFLRAPFQLEGTDSNTHRDHFSSMSGPCSEIPSEEAHCFPLESNRGVQEDQASK